MEPNEELEQLAFDWAEAKASEDAAKALRIEIEAKMLGILGDQVPTEGSKTLTLTRKRVKITTKMLRDLDLAAAAPIMANFPDEIRDSLIKIKREPSETGLKHLLYNNPDLYDKLAPAMTTKPAKPLFTVTEIGE